MPASSTPLATVLFPVFLMLVATVASLTMDKASALFRFLSFIGSPVMALLISLLLGLFTFGLFRRITMQAVSKFCD